MGRGFFSVLTGMGILIGLGLILTHGSSFQGSVKQVGSTASTLIQDLELTPKSGTH